jgi:hypothetical protein
MYFITNKSQNAYKTVPPLSVSMNWCVKSYYFMFFLRAEDMCGMLIISPHAKCTNSFDINFIEFEYAFFFFLEFHESIQIWAWTFLIS